MKLPARRPADEAPVVPLFEADDVSDVTRWLDPFPLTEEPPRTLTNLGGRDRCWGAWRSGRVVVRDEPAVAQ